MVWTLPQRPGELHPEQLVLIPLKQKPWVGRLGALFSRGWSPPLTCVNATALNKVDSDSCLPLSKWHDCYPSQPLLPFLSSHPIIPGHLTALHPEQSRRVSQI